MADPDSSTFAQAMEMPAANIVDLTPRTPAPPVRPAEWPREPGVRYAGKIAVVEDEGPSLAETVIDGAVAGVVGGLTMMLLRPLAEGALLRNGEEQESEWEHFVREKAEDAGRHPSDATVRVAGAGAHLGYGALWGAIYGATQRALDLPYLAHGLLFGGVVYAANFPKWGLMPLLGVLPPAEEQEPRSAGIPIATHIIFGLGTAVGFELLSRRRERAELRSARHE
jgi:hypothetical protein